LGYHKRVLGGASELWQFQVEYQHMEVS